MLMLLVVPVPAQADHFLGYDSVDGGEIRYGDSTRYDGAREHAIDTWNAEGSIDISPDGFWNVEDLTWEDADRDDVNWDGLYTNSFAADEIQLNVHYLQNYSSFDREAVAAHELGHALGLAHSFFGQLMYSCSTCSGVNTPQAHDRSDYHQLWGSSVTDFSNTRKLVGFAEDVFVGRVVKKVGTSYPSGYPETQFKVQVTRSVKGDLSGPVTVNQPGGIRAKSNTLMLFEGDELLKPGESYLFATRAYEAKGWQTLVPHYGDIKIKNSTHKTALLDRFHTATERQIAFQPRQS